MRFLLIILFVFYISPALAESQRTIIISLNNQPEFFDVYYSRAMTTATGMAVAGLIGYAIEESSRSNNDQYKKEQLLPYISDTKCQSRFLAALTKKLESDGFEIFFPTDEVAEEKISKELDIDIDSCGFKMVDSQLRQISSFISFKASLSDPDSGEELLKENFLITGKKKYSFNELVSTELEVDLEFAYALERAGKRLANKIIYNKPME